MLNWRVIRDRLERLPRRFDASASAAVASPSTSASSAAACRRAGGRVEHPVCLSFVQLQAPAAHASAGQHANACCACGGYCQKPHLADQAQQVAVGGQRLSAPRLQLHRGHARPGRAALAAAPVQVRRGLLCCHPLPVSGRLGLEFEEGLWLPRRSVSGPWRCPAPAQLSH